MYSEDYDDGECTAAPGVMGERACHRYPGCGCGQSQKSEQGPTKRVRLRLFGDGEIIEADIPEGQSVEDAQRELDEMWAFGLPGGRAESAEARLSDLAGVCERTAEGFKRIIEDIGNGGRHDAEAVAKAAMTDFEVLATLLRGRGRG